MPCGTLGVRSKRGPKRDREDPKKGPKRGTERTGRTERNREDLREGREKKPMGLRKIRRQGSRKKTRALKIGNEHGNAG